MGRKLKRVFIMWKYADWLAKDMGAPLIQKKICHEKKCFDDRLRSGRSCWPSRRKKGGSRKLTLRSFTPHLPRISLLYHQSVSTAAGTFYSSAYLAHKEFY